MADHRIGFEDLNEEVEADSLAVEGELPGWLSGVLVRNGPGRWDLEGDGDLRHWFDGLAMLHRFSAHCSGPCRMPQISGGHSRVPRARRSAPVRVV